MELNQNPRNNGPITFKSPLKYTQMAYRILIIDTETTGLPKTRNAPYTDLTNWPLPVQIGTIVYKCPHAGKPGRILRRRNLIVQPSGWTIPPESTAIHGITQEYALQNGKSLPRCLHDLMEELKYVNAICCHNAEFDMNVIHSAMFRFGLDEELRKIDLYPIICTMEIGKPICNIFMEVNGPYGKRIKLKSPRLSELYLKLFGEEFKGRLHDATEDCRATAEILGVLMEKYLPFVRSKCPDLFIAKTLPHPTLPLGDSDDDETYYPVPPRTPSPTSPTSPTSPPHSLSSSFHP